MSEFCSKCPVKAHLFLMDGISLAEVQALRRQVSDLITERDDLAVKVAARDKLIAQKNDEIVTLRQSK